MIKALLLALVFFTAGVATVKDYGINWDTINHLPRGQVYLHYFLDGKRDFLDLPKYKSYWQKPEDFSPDSSLSSQDGRLRSFYENEAFNFDWFIKTDGDGHPPLSDILSSVFNRALFGHFRLVNDIDAYRIYGILLSAALVGLVFFWTAEVFGTTTGIFASLSLALYPLFWSESHFNNEKDIPEATFIMFFLYCIWRGFTQKNWKWILVSGLFFGMGLGTKFNILFSIFVIVPWLLLYLGKKALAKENIKLYFASLIAFLGGIAIFYFSWPFLWQDQDIGVLKILGFYRSIGTTASLDPRFTGPFEINTYPSLWILYTTPVLILIFTAFGLWGIILSFKKDKTFTGFMFMLAFLVPIIRVSIPHVNIYGGVRQIMEYIPAMAAISGAGAGFLVNNLKPAIHKYLFILIVVPALLVPIVRNHPNENTYFNLLIGGLSGAKEKDFPSWGNSFGAAYRQGIVWLNENAPKGATIAFARELIPNVPKIWIRPDLNLDNRERSGPAKKGEYAFTLTYQGTADRSFYDSYLERELNPVYEVKVDGVAILKIWQNDLNHTKKEFLEEKELKNYELILKEDGFLIDLKENQRLARIEGKFKQDAGCKDLSYAFSEVSKDRKEWRRLPGTMPKEDWNTSAYGEQPAKDGFIQPFAGDEVKSIRYFVSPNDACFKKIVSLKIFAYE